MIDALAYEKDITKNFFEYRDIGKGFKDNEVIKLKKVKKVLTLTIKWVIKNYNFIPFSNMANQEKPIQQDETKQVENQQDETKQVENQQVENQQVENKNTLVNLLNDWVDWSNQLTEEELTEEDRIAWFRQSLKKYYTEDDGDLMHKETIIKVEDLYWIADKMLSWNPNENWNVTPKQYWWINWFEFMLPWMNNPVWLWSLEQYFEKPAFIDDEYIYDIKDAKNKRIYRDYDSWPKVIWERWEFNLDAMKWEDERRWSSLLQESMDRLEKSGVVYDYNSNYFELVKYLRNKYVCSEEKFTKYSDSTQKNATKKAILMVNYILCMYWNLRFWPSKNGSCKRVVISRESNGFIEEITEDSDYYNLLQSSLIVTTKKSNDAFKTNA